MSRSEIQLGTSGFPLRPDRNDRATLRLLDGADLDNLLALRIAPATSVGDISQAVRGALDFRQILSAQAHDGAAPDEMRGALFALLRGAERRG